MAFHAIGFAVTVGIGRAAAAKLRRYASIGIVPVGLVWRTVAVGIGRRRFEIVRGSIAVSIVRHTAFIHGQSRIVVIISIAPIAVVSAIAILQRCVSTRRITRRGSGNGIEIVVQAVVVRVRVTGCRTDVGDAVAIGVMAFDKIGDTVSIRIIVNVIRITRRVGVGNGNRRAAVVAVIGVIETVTVRVGAGRRSIRKRFSLCFDIIDDTVIVAVDIERVDQTVVVKVAGGLVGIRNAVVIIVEIGSVDHAVTITVGTQGACVRARTRVTGSVKLIGVGRGHRIAV